MRSVMHGRGQLKRFFSNRGCPRLERLEDRWVPSAVRYLPGFESSALPAGDDNSSKSIPLGFAINLHGEWYDSLFVNNNGNVTFGAPVGSFNPFALNYLERPVIAPFFADVDTRASGVVHFGHDFIDGHKAFSVIWEDVGYYNQRSDRTNTFQLVLIDRSDLEPGAFNVEFNYDKITWEKGQIGSSTARAGISTGSDVVGETIELPGSGVSGSFLDGRPTSLSHLGRFTFDVRPNTPPSIDPIGIVHLDEGTTLEFQIPASDVDRLQTLTYSLVSGPEGAVLDPKTGILTWTPSEAQPIGEYAFRVSVQDSGLLPQTVAQEFIVSLRNGAPVVTFVEPQQEHYPASATFHLEGNVEDTESDQYSGVVDFGDGSAPETISFNPDGSFALSHVFANEGRYVINVIVTDSKGGIGVSSYTVFILPEGSSGKVERYVAAEIQPGETVGADLGSEFHVGASIFVQMTHSEEADQPASVFIAFFTEAPVTTELEGIFFDVKLTNLHPDNDIVLTFDSDILTKKFEFGYFDPSDEKWVNLLKAIDLAEVTHDPETGRITVRFKVTHIFNGTVFTVSLASSSPPSTGPVKPPTAGVGNEPGLSRTVSFNNNSQLSLALTASRNNQLSANGTSQGSQAANAAANGVPGNGVQRSSLNSATAGVGGNDDQRPVETSEDIAFWEWLEGEAGILELLMLGVDPEFLLPKKPAAQQPPADQQPVEQLPADGEQVSTDTEQSHVFLLIDSQEDDEIVEDNKEEEANSLGFFELAPAMLLTIPATAWHHRRRKNKTKVSKLTETP